MTPNHHPSEAWLLDFTLGNLSPAFETVLNAHVGTCEACQDNVRLAESFGGEILAGLPKHDAVGDLSSVSAQLTLEKEQGNRTPIPTSRAIETVTSESFEHFVETYLNSSIGALRWRALGKGLNICRLSSDNDVRLWMLKAQSGTVLPDHSHSGSELTMVLKGAYFCGSEIFRAGDIEDADESTVHRPVVTGEGECICLAVTEGNLKFQSWLPRLVQPLIGI